MESETPFLSNYVGKYVRQIDVDLDMRERKTFNFKGPKG